MDAQRVSSSAQADGSAPGSATPAPAMDSRSPQASQRLSEPGRPHAAGSGQEQAPAGQPLLAEPLQEAALPAISEQTGSGQASAGCAQPGRPHGDDSRGSAGSPERGGQPGQGQGGARRAAPFWRSVASGMPPAPQSPFLAAQAGGPHPLRGLQSFQKP